MNWDKDHKDFRRGKDSRTELEFYQQDVWEEEGENKGIFDYG